MKSKQVSTMIRQGFISDPTISSFSPSRTFSSPSPPPSTTRPSQPQTQTQTQSLFDMMSDDQNRDAKLSDEKRRKMQDRVKKLLEEASFSGGDVKLTVVGKEGLKVSMDVQKSVLADKSRFFAEKLRCDGADGNGNGMTHSVEISDCDDVDVYVEAVVLMHCVDLNKRLRFIAEDGVSKVLNLLKVSAAIMFDLGVMSCLEYLEAIPWTEDEQEEVISQLGHLQLHDSATEVLLRVSSSSPSTAARADDIFTSLLSGVLQAKDDKARREMKSLLSKLLNEDAYNDGNKLDVSKDTLYHLCQRCIGSLVLCLSEANDSPERPDRGVLMSEIAREADNIQWIVDILICKRMGDEFVKIWAEQKELAALHSKVQIIYRYEISRITAQLCIGIGRGHILVPKEIRFSPKIVKPTQFITSDKRRVTQALMTWNVTCTYSQFLAQKTPTCCVSLSSFYNDTIVDCPTCTCGCQNKTQPDSCVNRNSPHLSSVVSSSGKPLNTPLVQCTSHMCPIRVHWHVKLNYKEYWRIKITITNFNYRMNYSQWNLVVQHPNFDNLTQLFSFKYKSLNPYEGLNDTGMLWGVKFYNDFLSSAGSLGNVQSEILFRKDKSTFTFDKGWAFPRRIYFNGDNCVMPPPDAYPWSPNASSKLVFSLLTTLIATLASLLILLS